MGRNLHRKFAFLAPAMLALAIVAAGSRAHAQVVAQAPLVAGVEVDAHGVLRTKIVADPNGQLIRQAREAAKAQLNPKLAAVSKLRKVSLNRLEEAVQEQLAGGKRLTDEMQYLAGMTRIQYVFCYPDTKDIVIAGPAEGWVADPAGRIVGMQSGRPVIELEDLIVALRAFPGKGRGAGNIGCSIDPTKEGLARMQHYIRQAPPNGSAADTERFVAGMQEALGLQTVSVHGVPSNTHFAHVLVEADYRMKLIGIGLEKPLNNLKSYVDRANPGTVARNALCRWYFVPDYQCVRMSDDSLAMELVGEGVKLVGADEVVLAGGARQQTSGTDGASKAFVTDFTKKYPQLAAVAPVYAQLRNLIDLSVASAFIQQQDFRGKTGWNMATWDDENKTPVQTVNAPQQVETAINAIWRGHTLMTPIGGGVSIDARQAVQSSNLLKDADGKVSQARDKLDLKDLPKGKWWWD